MRNDRIARKCIGATLKLPDQARFQRLVDTAFAATIFEQLLTVMRYREANCPGYGMRAAPRTIGLAVAACLCIHSVEADAATTDGAALEIPGPSAALFAKPFYMCRRTYYVAPTGNDADAGTRSAPWATLQHADSGAGGRAAGDCVSVAPGVYAAGVNLRHGGGHADPGGYVAYRCQVLDGCKITAAGGNAVPAFSFNSAGGPNYVVIDGFELAASTKLTYGVGILITNNPAGAPTSLPSSHHVWMLNNTIHGYGQGGIGTNEADWLFILHNTVYETAEATCDAQGSGIGVVVAKATPSYSLTDADRAWGPFHQVVAWNITRGNTLRNCGNATSAYDTDGNGIIMDSFNGSGLDSVLYPNQSLVANNITFDNGGKGIAIFRSSHVTVANNTAYNNSLDPWNGGYPRGEISNLGGTDNIFINNITYATPAGSPADPRCLGATYDRPPARCPLMANAGFVSGNAPGVVNAGNSWINNISFGGTTLNIWGKDPAGTGNYMFDADKYSCLSNRCGADPLLKDAGAGNFALTSKSPATEYARRETYLPVQDIDGGACHHALTHCP